MKVWMMKYEGISIKSLSPLPGVHEVPSEIPTITLDNDPRRSPSSTKTSRYITWEGDTDGEKG